MTSAVPAAPSNLTATELSQTQVSLSWTSNSNNQTGFRIYFDGGNGPILIGTVGANVTTFVDNNANPNDHVCYQVTAYNSAGESGKTAGAKPAVQGPAEAKARQLARVWVYWDAVYPSAIKRKPGTVLLRVENQVGFDVNLVLTKLTGESTGPVTTLGAQGKTLRNIQVVELGAGLYEYHDQSRSQIKGRLIVEP